MESHEILDHFKRTNALLDGHFVLSSGLHSSRYLQCALALEETGDAINFGKLIADKLRAEGVLDGARIIASPAIGGLVIGFAVARALGHRFIWTERQNGEMTLRRGFSIPRGEKVIVVEDVVTTGRSTRECISALEANGADAIAAASIIDRSNGEADLGVPLVSLASLAVPSYEPAECPLCAEGTEAIKPGSRGN